MKASGWRGNRTGVDGINGLIPLPVERRRFPVPRDIRRQRRLAEGSQGGGEITRIMKCQSKTATAHFANDLRGHSSRKDNPAADLRFLGAVDERNPENAPSGKSFEQKHLHLAATLFSAPQTRRENLGIVQYQEIARVKKVSQIRKHAMNQLAGLSLNHQEARHLSLPA